MRYDIIAWDTASNTNLNVIRRLQKSTINIIRTNNSTNTFHFNSIEHLYKISLLKAYYKDAQYRIPIRRHNVMSNVTITNTKYQKQLWKKN